MKYSLNVTCNFSPQSKLIRGLVGGEETFIHEIEIALQLTKKLVDCEGAEVFHSKSLCFPPEHIPF